MSLLTNFFGRHDKSNPLLENCSIAGGSHVGRVRRHNEDAYVCACNSWDNAVLLGVADGMGGHEGGEIASYIATRSLLSEWICNGHANFSCKADVRDFLSRSLCSANDHIYSVNQKLNIRWKMGTTVTMGVVWRNKLTVAQVGDSRCYRMRNGNIKLLTSDHNWMNEMIENGGMSPEEAEAHPLAQTLTNCVGTFENLRIDFGEHTIAKGDRFLFCSDGLSSYIDVELISEQLNGYDTACTAVRRLVDVSLTSSGADNITAVCLFI
jgi:serine/threonine protein phosphatase PrpC